MLDIKELTLEQLTKPKGRPVILRAKDKML
jgi:hypothetical protein